VRTYYPDYTPKNDAKFKEMDRDLRKAINKEMYESFRLLYMLDMSYPREDILVVTGRIEREKGWR